MKVLLIMLMYVVSAFAEKPGDLNEQMVALLEEKTDAQEELEKVLVSPEKLYTLEAPEPPPKKISASLNGLTITPEENVSLTVNVQPFNQQIKIGASKNF